MYYTYIVASRSHNFYVGVTSDLYKRMWQHKDGFFAGYSKSYKCNRLVWMQGFGSVVDAITREKQLKGWRRSKKIALIEVENAAWIDLSAGWGEVMEAFQR